MKEKINLIGIAGRINSGKDTVAKIIQDLTHLAPEGYRKELFYSWEVRKFAGKLKEVAGLLLSVSPELFESQEFKKTLLPDEWNYKDENGNVRYMTVRTLLQKIGTESMRDNLHENVWVNALFRDYVPDSFGTSLPNWLISDTRFPNEAQAIKDKGGIVIRVNRPGVEKRTHPSETALDDWKFDWEIDNSEDYEHLIEEVEKMLIHFGIIEKIIV